MFSNTANFFPDVAELSNCHILWLDLYPFARVVKMFLKGKELDPLTKYILGRKQDLKLLQTMLLKFYYLINTSHIERRKKLINDGS